MVLSYKNHAIDEFLVDLVKAEGRQLSLIRIGGQSSEPILRNYLEFNQQSFKKVSKQAFIKPLSLEHRVVGPKSGTLLLDC